MTSQHEENKKTIRPWRTIARETIFRDGFKNIESLRCQLPNGLVFPHYYVDHYHDWVNVVALTETDQFIFVRQYRHAFGEITVETAAGTMDAGEEDPESAARRELLEETGYIPGTMRKLGALAPNPALQDNLVHIFLATQCRSSGPQRLDRHEDIEVVLIERTCIEEEINRGLFNHALALVAVLMALRTLQSERSPT